jgi:hypothetical protein
VLFKDGKTTPISVTGVEWGDSFISATQHMVDVLQKGITPRLDGLTGKAVLEFALAVQESARTGKEIHLEL